MRNIYALFEPLLLENPHGICVVLFSDGLMQIKALAHAPPTLKVHSARRNQPQRRCTLRRLGNRANARPKARA
jgi:hypothetical protein